MFRHRPQQEGFVVVAIDLIGIELGLPLLVGIPGPASVGRQHMFRRRNDDLVDVKPRRNRHDHGIELRPQLGGTVAREQAVALVHPLLGSAAVLHHRHQKRAAIEIVLGEVVGRTHADHLPWQLTVHMYTSVKNLDAVHRKNICSVRKPPPWGTDPPEFAPVLNRDLEKLSKDQTGQRGAGKSKEDESAK